MTKTSITRNCLTHKQAFQLANWVTTNQDTIKNQTQSAIAVRATTELGFTVVASNVAAAVDIAGVDIGSPRRHSGKDRQDRCQVLAEEIISLLKKMGEPVSERLVAVAKRKGVH